MRTFNEFMRLVQWIGRERGWELLFWAICFSVGFALGGL